MRLCTNQYEFFSRRDLHTLKMYGKNGEMSPKWPTPQVIFNM
ncbi:MAG: hypothetical protein SWO11_02850 [Thermodesulfobacteriota bacterium]|nr:hypothetical protein [Thermodesulfobacteriota bacterium]